MLLTSALAGGLLALSFGFSAEWDLLNYHFYNPHALLTGRDAIDVAPAQMQSYLNPTLYIPLYLIFETFPIQVLVFVTGAIQGGQMVLVYLIAQQVIGRERIAPVGLLIVAGLGCLGPIFLNQLGSTPADTILSSLVLAGLLLILKSVDVSGGKECFRIGLMAGALLGAAVALKLTFAIYAVPLGLVLLVSGKPENRLRLVISYGVGTSAGFLLMGGYWFLNLWQVYGNPFFPYFNNVFESNWIGAGNFRDLRFMPRSLWESLFYPYIWYEDPRRVWEVDFKGLRILVLYPVMFLLPLLRWRWLGKTSPSLRLLLVFLAVSYFFWIRLFSIYRYLVIIEILAPLTLLAVVLVMTERARWGVLALALLIASQFQVDFHRNIPTWRFNNQTVTALADLDSDAMIIIDSTEPLAYLALWTPDDVPIIRIRANFMNAAQNSGRLYDLAEQRIKSHAGKFYLLHTEPELQKTYMTADLERVGLALENTDDCIPVFGQRVVQRWFTPVLCPLEKGVTAR